MHYVKSVHLSRDILIFLNLSKLLMNIAANCRKKFLLDYSKVVRLKKKRKGILHFFTYHGLNLPILDSNALQVCSVINF